MGAVAAGPVAAEDIAAFGEAISVPSGQDVRFIKLRRADLDDGPIYRLRFLAPGIGDGSIDFARAEPDMVYLCERWALPRLAGARPAPAEIVVSLSDRMLPFGTTAPEATQFFDAFVPGDDGCVRAAY